MGTALAERMAAVLNLHAALEPLPGSTDTVWAIGDQVLRIGPTGRMEKELAASAAASTVVRVPRVLDRVDIDDQTGLLIERIRGGPAGDTRACTHDEAHVRGHRCGALQRTLASVSAPAMLPPPPWAGADEGAPVLLHLDLHPFNILAEPAGELVVIDWANAAAGPAVLDLARTAVTLTFDPAARRRAGDSRWVALVQGWSDECDWAALPDAAWIWALRFLLHDLDRRCSPLELEPAADALAGLLR